MNLIAQIVCLLAIIEPDLREELVTTQQGAVRGKLVDYNGVKYYSYQGIPYAESPVGKLRFLPPQPKTPWNGTLDATNVGSVCPQPEGSYSRERMSEDCLFLNVYVPKRASNEVLPVLVYIHGGAFQSLSGNDDFIYGPQLFMQRNVVFVTCNYRLGALGWLSLDIEEATGNSGLKDLLMALQWIKQNIQQFGGNPNQITLGGNSAGSGLAHYLTLSDKSAGLFQRIILTSGSALGYRFYSRHAKDVAIQLSQELGVRSDDPYDTLQRLKHIDAFDIIDATQRLGANDTRKGIRDFAPFVPSAEIETSHAIITEDPMKIIREGIPQNVPVLVGFNFKEGIKMLPTVLKDQTLLDEINASFELCIPTDIEYPYGSNESLNLATSIRKFYFNNSVINNATLDGFIDFIRETQYTYSIDKWIQLHKERSDSNDLFYYVFNYDSGLNWFKIVVHYRGRELLVPYPGTAHTDEAGYTFVTNATQSRLANLNSRDETMMNIMMTYWTNFVKFGNPSPVSPTEPTVHTNWEATTAERNYLLLKLEPENISRAPLAANIQFWSQIYEEYDQYVRNGGQTVAKVIP